MTGKGKAISYDWAQAVLSVAKTNSTDIGELAKAAALDPLAGDLSDVDLTDLDLSGQNFAGWDLRHAKLANAKLSQTELRGAKLDIRELIRATEWENAELDVDVRQKAMRLKEWMEVGLFLGYNPVLLMKADELQLSVRSTNLLKNDNIVYLGDLIQKTEAEFRRTPNVTRKSLNEIKAVLAEMGLHLGMEVPGWPPEKVEKLAKWFESLKLSSVKNSDFTP